MKDVAEIRYLLPYNGFVYTCQLPTDGHPGVISALNETCEGGFSGLGLGSKVAAKTAC